MQSSLFGTILPMDLCLLTEYVHCSFRESFLLKIASVLTGGSTSSPLIHMVWVGHYHVSWVDNLTQDYSHQHVGQVDGLTTMRGETLGNEKTHVELSRVLVRRETK